MPANTLSSMECLIRKFLWYSTPEKRPIHLVSWERVTTPKAEGGLGIRRLANIRPAIYVWKARNARIFKGIKVLPQIVAVRAKTMTEESARLIAKMQNISSIQVNKGSSSN
ncbi:hypothetical protein QJS10_CPB18g01621 [Acorus calamus]|uniref:Uncharacterized protein n=1 Tax=Acorus calamus TaxID=4465 RepID=A0AAV9CQL9_ACOCL|nr:hypothetical protein QJS10_CPB18g01621 [Acorus calamus]